MPDSELTHIEDGEVLVKQLQKDVGENRHVPGVMIVGADGTQQALGGSGGTSMTDDSGFAVGGSSVTPVGYLADDTATDSVDEGDIGAPRMTLDRQPYAVAALQSNEMRAGGVALTPKFAIINASASGDNTIVAAVGGKKIRVLRYTAIARDVVTARWYSALAGIALSGPLDFSLKGGIAEPFCPVGIYETAVGQPLVLNLSSAVLLGGYLTYIEV